MTRKSIFILFYYLYHASFIILYNEPTIAHETERLPHSSYSHHTYGLHYNNKMILDHSVMNRTILIFYNILILFILILYYFNIIYYFIIIIIQ
jgi:hypothetical protein